MASTETAIPPRPRRWLSETRRAVASTIAGTVGTAIVVTVWILFVPEDAGLAIPLGTVVAWTILVATHAVLTARAFTGLSGAALDAGLSASGARRRSATALPSWSVQVSVLALLVVVAIAVVPGWRDHPLLLIGALAMVGAAWADMVVSFALHYAAIDDGRFEFADDDERGFGDYVYAAIAVQATGALPDIAARTRGLRRQLSVHKVLAFVFNTVIVAIVVALLLRG